MYTRRQLARAWRLPPWAIDQVPWHEIETELVLTGIENDARRYRAEREARERKMRGGQ